jgi:RNA polymerase sigma-70 factor (ECF subfamily)
LHGVLRQARIAEACVREAKELVAAAPIDVFDRRDRGGPSHSEVTLTEAKLFSGVTNFPDALGQVCGVGEKISDAELIRRSLGDPDAFVAVFERHFDELYGYLARRLGRDAGSDLASEVFVRAYAGRVRYDLEREDARPWLYGIAANLIYRRRRSEARMLRAYARTDPPTPSENQHGEGRDPALAAALAGLDPREREALFLYTWADLDYEEIAQALAIPVGTVRSRLNRARSRIRADLERESAPQVEEAFNG